MPQQPMKLPQELEDVLVKANSIDSDIARTILTSPDPGLGRRYLKGEVARGTTYNPAGRRHMVSPFILWALRQREAMEKSKKPVSGFVMGGASSIKVVPLPGIRTEPVDLGDGIRIYAAPLEEE